MQKYEDLGRQLEENKKKHEVEVRQLRKTHRKAMLEFFKAKSEHVLKVFKQE